MSLWVIHLQRSCRLVPFRRKRENYLTFLWSKNFRRAFTGDLGTHIFSKFHILCVLLNNLYVLKGIEHPEISIKYNHHSQKQNKTKKMSSLLEKFRCCEENDVHLNQKGPSHDWKNRDIKTFFVTTKIESSSSETTQLGFFYDIHFFAWKHSFSSCYEVVSSHAKFSLSRWVVFSFSNWEIQYIGL